MLLYLMGLVDILAAIFIVIKPGLSVLVWAVILGLLYKFAVSFFARGFSVKFFATADLLAALSIYTGFDFGLMIGGMLIIIHFIKGLMSFMGMPFLRDTIFMAGKSAFRPTLFTTKKRENSASLNQTALRINRK